MLTITRDKFAFNAIGVYSFDGKIIEVKERLSAYGSGRKTVYTAIIDGVEYSRKDITFYKRLFGIIPGGAVKERKSAPKQAPKEEVKQEPKQEPKQDSKPGKSAEIRHTKFNDILAAVNLNIPVYLYGPAGSGKNVICKQIADALNVDFYFSNSVTDEYKITGFTDANGRYQATEFYNAWTRGGLFMLDELDASIPEVLTLLNAALANGYFSFPAPIGRVSAHPNFRVIAAGNTLGRGANEQYTGRYVLDAATLDRFIPIPVNYDARVEASICHDNDNILNFVRAMRKAAEKIGYNMILGYRCINYLTKLQTAFTPALACEYAVLKGMDADTRAALRDNYSGDKNNPYFAAL